MNIKEHLGKGEYIVAEAKISKLPLVVAGLIGLLAIIIAIAVDEEEIIIIGVAFAIVLLLAVAIKIFTTFLYITNNRVIGQIGFIKLQSIDLPIRKVNSISTETTLFGQLLNYSTIIVASASGTMHFKMVNNAEKIRRIASEQIDSAENHGRPAPPEHICPNCESIVYGEPRFCPSCGCPIRADKPAKKCGVCGKLIDADAVFCPSCGCDTRGTASNKEAASDKIEPLHSYHKESFSKHTDDTSPAHSGDTKSIEKVADVCTTTDSSVKKNGFSAPTDLD